jgi:hypothetical protein
MLGHDTPKHGLSVAHTTEEAESVRRCESRAIGSQGYGERGSGQLPVDHLPRAIRALKSSSPAAIRMRAYSTCLFRGQ